LSIPEYVHEIADVPKLPLHTLREPSEALRAVSEAEQMIDEAELAVLADLLLLEASARDQDAYEGEIFALEQQLAETKRQLDDLPGAGRKGGFRV